VAAINLAPIRLTLNGRADEEPPSQLPLLFTDQWHKDLEAPIKQYRWPCGDVVHIGHRWALLVGRPDVEDELDILPG
jgi:hypothetical protein